MSSVSGKQTLVILTPGFPKDESDTTCLPFLQTHLTALRENSPATEFIILTFQYPFIVGRYRWKGFEVVSFGGRERGKFNRLLLWSKAWNTLKALQKEKQLLGFFSLWCTECALLGHHFGRLHGIKHFTWLCGQDAKKENKYIKLTRPKAEELVAMSDFLKDEFYKNHGILPAHVIPKGITHPNSPPDNNVRHIDVLGVGSLIPLKQYDIFVNTIGQLRDSTPGINSMICGMGPEKERLASMIIAQDLHDNVCLHGEVTQDNVLELMQRSKILAHTSCYEGFSGACLEALAAGAHVVSFTRPMDYDIENWHYVKDPEEMRSTIGNLLKAPRLSHKPVIPFGLDDAARRLLALFS